MSRSLLRFALTAMVGLSVFALAQTPAHAQFRRVVPVRPVPVYPVAVRRPIVVPPITGYVNNYVLPGVTLNRLATYNALNRNALMYRYASPYAIYNPYVLPYSPAILPYTTPLATPGLSNNFYNPYFSSYGIYP